MHILVVEDDRDVAQQLKRTLSGAGHEVTVAFDGDEGYEQASNTAFDVLILDRMMPGRNGLEMLTALREKGMRTPALVLSALGQVDDRVAGLKAGGDDYLTKPYATEELLARVEALGRRTEKASDTTLTVGDLELDRIQHSARRAGKDIVLQPREYRLLEYLMSNQGRLVTRTMLLQHVWDLHFDPQTNVIDVHVSRLRGKIDKEFDRPLLHTVRGRGYRMSEEADGSD